MQVYVKWQPSGHFVAHRQSCGVNADNYSCFCFDKSYKASLKVTVWNISLVASILIRIRNSSPENDMASFHRFICDRNTLVFFVISFPEVKRQHKLFLLLRLLIRRMLHWGHTENLFHFDLWCIWFHSFLHIICVFDSLSANDVKFAYLPHLERSSCSTVD